MYIAYSALRNKQQAGNPLSDNKELAHRSAGYTAACNKYHAEIKAIQKYLPGWTPPFEMKA